METSVIKTTYVTFESLSIRIARGGEPVLLLGTVVHQWLTGPRQGG